LDSLLVAGFLAPCGGTTGERHTHYYWFTVTLRFRLPDEVGGQPGVRCTVLFPGPVLAFFHCAYGTRGATAFPHRTAPRHAYDTRLRRSTAFVDYWDIFFFSSAGGPGLTRFGSLLLGGLTYPPHTAAYRIPFYNHW